MTSDEFQAAVALAAQNIVADKELRKWRKVWLGVAVVALLGGAWMWRYEVVSASNASHLRLDRWTGSVNICGGTAESGKCVELHSP